MSDKTRRLACLDLNRNFKYRRIINDDNGDNNSCDALPAPPGLTETSNWLQTIKIYIPLIGILGQ